MPPKRAAPTDIPSPAASKLPRIDQPIGHDFSSTVKKRLSNSSRTGQACDRCKIRKIRCDGGINGCSPCAQNNTPCKTTDRISGRASVRGHAEHLESELSYLRHIIGDLERQMKEAGIEPKPVQSHSGYVPASSVQPPGSATWGQPSGQTGDLQLWGETSPSSTSIHNGGPIPVQFPEPDPVQDVESTLVQALPAYKAGSVGGNYLGVSAGSSAISPIKGMSMTLFGMEFDLSNFLPDDLDDPNSPTSYRHFMKVVVNNDPTVDALPFPEYAELRQYSVYFLRSINPFLGLVSKPHFMELIQKIYKENYQPSSAETVMVHMMLAIIIHQMATRNNDTKELERSNKHYRYALTFVHQLLVDPVLESVQAMALVSLHARNFPRPGAAWYVLEMSFKLAIETGLHRSAKAWGESLKQDIHEIEMRKRIFWGLHTLLVGISGKSGRPMPIRVEDMDIEFPLPIDDSLPEERGTPEAGRCSFLVGIQYVKIGALLSQMYSTIYAVRQSPQSYEANIRRWEGQLQQWRNQIPPEFTATQPESERHIFARYIHFWDNEFQMMLRHPALCRSTDPKFLAENLDKCLSVCTEILHDVYEIMRFKSMDIPWTACISHIAALFTTLFVWSQKKDQMTEEDVGRLSSDMTLWLAIMDEAGRMLRTGDRLKVAIAKVVDTALQNFASHIQKKSNSDAADAAASAAMARAALSQSNQDDSEARGNAYMSGASYNGTYPDSLNHSGVNGNKTGNYLPPDETLNSAPNPYPAVGSSSQYSYTDTNTNSLPTTYTNPSPNAFDQQSYQMAESSDLNVAQAAHAAAVAASAAAAQPSMNAFMYSNTQTPTPPNPSPTYAPSQGGPQTHVAWRQWMMSNMPQDGSQSHRQPANLEANPHLLTIPDSHSQSPVSMQQTSGPQTQGNAQTVGGAWPNMIFSIGQNGGV